MFPDSMTEEDTIWQPTGRETEAEMVARAGRGLAIVMQLSGDDTCEFVMRDEKDTADIRHICDIPFWLPEGCLQESGSPGEEVGDWGDECVGRQGQERIIKVYGCIFLLCRCILGKEDGERACPDIGDAVQKSLPTPVVSVACLTRMLHPSAVCQRDGSPAVVSQTSSAARQFQTILSARSRVSGTKEDANGGPSAP